MSKIYLSFILLLLAFAACNPGRKEVEVSFNSYQFDQAVIAKLPVYDSLAKLLIANFSLFGEHINQKDSYQAYRYMPGSDESYIFKEPPALIKGAVDSAFNKLGKDFIYGFDVFKDSSIKIYIRSKPSDKTSVRIDENLSYFPLGKITKRREFPEKDSILDPHWQYWTRFNKQTIL